MLGKNLKELRIKKGVTQDDMAELLNIHQTTYSDYELGRLNIPISTLKELAVFFNTSVDYLLDMTDNPNPYPKK